MGNQPTERVDYGSWVKVTGFVPGEEEVFELVPESQADYAENRIPPSSPLARALVGAKVGDTVKFCPPAGEVELEVLDSGRLEEDDP